MAGLRRFGRGFASTRRAVRSGRDHELRRRPLRAPDQLLGAPFRWVVTAEQLRSYKPNRRNFERALEQIGAPRERIVHVAQSLFHDHVPAKQLGLRTVWINRRAGRAGSGATPPAHATPDLTFDDMASFSEFALRQSS